MKVTTKEVYSIEDLTREEMLFLFELIEKTKLAESSSPLSREIYSKFELLRQEVANTPALSYCVGCHTTEDVDTHWCPVVGTEQLLCLDCFQNRKATRRELDKRVHESF